MNDLALSIIDRLTKRIDALEAELAKRPHAIQFAQQQKSPDAFDKPLPPLRPGPWQKTPWTTGIAAQVDNLQRFIDPKPHR